MEACTFEQYEVYAIDVAMTSGDGKPRAQGKRTTVFKRLVDMKYGLKVRTQLLSHERMSYVRDVLFRVSLF